MTVKVYRPVEEMLPALHQVINWLAPHTTRIAVAGSIRRGEYQVADIELVCQPVGEAVHEACNEALRLRQIRQRTKSNGHLHAWGPRHKAFWFRNPDGSEVPVDLFCVLDDRQWGVTFLIRTGPAEANDCLVTQLDATNQRGRLGILPRGMKMLDGALWRDGKPLSTPEERDVFAAIGLPYIPPVLRSYELYRALRAGQPLPPFPHTWLDGRDDFFLFNKRQIVQAPTAPTVEPDAPPVQQELF